MHYFEKLIENIVSLNEHKLSIFAQRCYSFEEWLNLELCASLCLDPSIDDDSVRNTPKYEQDNERLDIAFQRNGNKYAIELKVAHPGTLEKYKDACIYDLTKLKKATDYDHRLFVLVIASTLSVDDFNHDPEWNNWIENIFTGQTVKRNSISYHDIKGSAHIYVTEISAN